MSRRESEGLSDIMELKLVNEQGAQTSVTVSDTLFGREYNEALVHQLVVAYQANARSGNRKQKDREEVHHSTKKPFKQKGTGRARAGMTVILSQLAREGRLVVVDGFTVEAPKTRLVADKMRALGLTSALVITDKVDENLGLAYRNIPNFAVIEPNQADPVSLLHFSNVVMTKAAVSKMEESLA